MERHHPLEVLSIHSPANTARISILVVVVVNVNGFSQIVHDLLVLFCQRDQHGVRIGGALMGLCFRDGCASSGNVFLHKRHNLVHALPTAFIVMGCWRPKYAPWRCLQFASWSRHCGGVSRVYLVINNARPHGVIAWKIDALYVVPG